MNLKLAPSLSDRSKPFADDRSIAIPFLPHRRVSRRTAFWAVAVGIWPVIIYKIFAAGARERREAKLARRTRDNAVAENP